MTAGSAGSGGSATGLGSGVDGSSGTHGTLTVVPSSTVEFVASTYSPTNSVSINLKDGNHFNISLEDSSGDVSITFVPTSGLSAGTAFISPTRSNFKRHNVERIDWLN